MAGYAAWTPVADVAQVGGNSAQRGEEGAMAHRSGTVPAPCIAEHEQRPGEVAAVDVPLHDGEGAELPQRPAGNDRGGEDPVPHAGHRVPDRLLAIAFHQQT